MTWWQWALAGSGTYLAVGFVISVIYVRHEWAGQVKHGRDPDAYNLGDVASFVCFVWPFIVLAEGLPALFGLIAPLFRVIYTPAAVRKAMK